MNDSDEKSERNLILDICLSEQKKEQSLDIYDRPHRLRLRKDKEKRQFVLP